MVFHGRGKMRGIKKIPTWQFLEVKKWVGTFGENKRLGAPGETPGVEAIQGCVDGGNRPGTPKVGTFESMIFRPFPFGRGYVIVPKVGSPVY